MGHKPLRSPFYTTPDPKKEGPSTPSFRLIWSLSWDGGGVEGGIFEFHEWGTQALKFRVNFPDSSSARRPESRSTQKGSRTYTISGHHKSTRLQNWGIYFWAGSGFLGYCSCLNSFQCYVSMLIMQPYVLYPSNIPPHDIRNCAGLSVGLMQSVRYKFH